MRDVDDEAAGQRDLGREPRALRLHRVLDRLDEDLLAALDQILDLARALAALELRADDLVDVEEAVLLEADLDERGLHARQHVVDDAEVDVPGDRAALGPLEVDLGDLVVLEHGDALLARVDRDDELALRLRQRRALRRRAPAGLGGVRCLRSGAFRSVRSRRAASAAAARRRRGRRSSCGCVRRACRGGASSARFGGALCPSAPASVRPARRRS